MGKRLYVGNLPYDADEAAIRAAFAEAGTIERVHIPLDRETQRPRGFAFVEMSTEEEARQAVATMNGAVIGTRTLRVSEAEDRRPAGSGGPGRGGPGRGGPRPDRGPGGGGSDGDSHGGDARGHGGAPRHGDDGGGRSHRFGPDAKPKREREREARKSRSRRRPSDDDDDFHGRHGSRRFDEDDDY